MAFLNFGVKPSAMALLLASVETMIMKASALRHLNGITVADLIAELETMNQDAKVLFVCDYGDYHHTQQALPVNEIVEADTGDLEESAYSQSRVAFIEERDANDEPDEDGEDETEPVVILK